MHQAVIIGAGPAGLATSRELLRRGIAHVVLERGDEVGRTWARLYDSLVLHTGKHLSALPGMPFPRAVPLFPNRRDFLAYLHRYADRFQLPVETSVDVTSVNRDADGWNILTSRGPGIRARTLVMATGIVSNPCVPAVDGRAGYMGRVLHSADYRTPDDFKGKRVLVVGTGNTAGEISAELARAGSIVTVAVRSGRRVVPRQLLGVPIQYFAVGLVILPRTAQRTITAMVSRMSEVARGPSPLPPPRTTDCPDVPLIGFHLTDAVRSGAIRLKGALAAFTSTGVRFSDGSDESFDDVILATGYKPALGALGNLIRVDECGFACRHGRVLSADQPRLYFVGHNYDTRGALRNISRDARLAARLIDDDGI